MTASEQNRQMAALGRAVKKLTVALDQADAENADLRAEIAALRGRIREAYSMLRPMISWQGGEIYQPTIRLPALEEWEATPEVQRALGQEPKP